MLAAEIASDGETSTSGVDEKLSEVLSKAAEEVLVASSFSFKVLQLSFKST